MNQLKTPQFILALAYTAVYAGIMWAVLSGYAKVPENLIETLKPLLGIMTLVQGQVVNYFFQSSFGSKSKDEAMIGIKPQSDSN